MKRISRYEQVSQIPSCFNKLNEKHCRQISASYYMKFHEDLGGLIYVVFRFCVNWILLMKNSYRILSMVSSTNLKKNLEFLMGKLKKKIVGKSFAEET